MLYVPNRDFAGEWQASTEALEVARNLAEAALPIAKSMVPKDTEDLAESLEVDAAVVEGQATGRLRATDFKGHWVEFGTRRSDSGGKAQPYLRPAMEAATGSAVTGGRR